MSAAVYRYQKKQQISFYYIGGIQNPVHSIIALVEDNFPIYSRPIGIKNNDSHFSIKDEQSEYLGK